MIQNSQGKKQESLKSLERSLAIQEGRLGAVHPLVVDVREAVARLRAQLKPVGEETKRPATLVTAPKTTGSLAATPAPSTTAGKPGPQAKH